MNRKRFTALLRAYLNNQAKETESNQVDAWYDSFPDSSESSPLENDTVKRRIYNQLSERLKKHVEAPKIARLVIWPYVAASISLAFVLSAVLFFQKSRPVPTANYSYVSTKPGSIKKIKLPDGSYVWLNSGSIIKFTSSGFASKRDVYLQDGEAFFEVKKDKLHPFRVISQLITTQVYGTSFNVRAYKKLNYNTVNVRTGKVRVQSKKAWYPDTLRADQSLTYTPQKGFIRLVPTQHFEGNSWIEGTINLKDASFEELSLMFYNKYKLRLTSNVGATHSQRYSIVLFHDQPIYSALKLICSIHNNHYRRNNHVVTITP